MERGRVKMRKPAGRGMGAINSRMLTVPAHIAQKIPDGTIFEAKLTDEGLLYRPVEVPASEQTDPAWVKGGGDK